MISLGDFMARRIGDDLLDELHVLQTIHDREVVVAAALGAAVAALGFIRDAAGDRAVEEAAAMIAGAVARRQDRPVPLREVDR